MGGIWFPRSELISAVGDTVGYKSGLAVGHSEVADLLAGEYSDYWLGDPDQVIRIRSEVYEDLVSEILYKLGNIPSPSNAPVLARLFHKYKADPALAKVCLSVLGKLPDFLQGALEKAQSGGTKTIDPTPFVEAARKEHGTDGALIALEAMDGLAEDQHRSPWGMFRRIEWKDTYELGELFASESLDTFHGEFFDQRFVDYLDRNFGDISRINWRKFEGLVGEFFHRLGFTVEMGEGRNDDGVDVRIWPSDVAFDKPPLMIVQCKRQKSKIEKVVVKALWADVLATEAQSGLIATTSELAPGARTTCTARGYNIQEANRSTLANWVTALRTPFSGIV